MRVFFPDHSSSCRYLQPITEGVDRGHRSWGGGSHCINSQKWREVNSGAQFPFSFIFSSRPRPVEQCCPQLPVSQAVLDPFKLIGLNIINSGNKQANKQKHPHLTSEGAVWVSFQRPEAWPREDHGLINLQLHLCGNPLLMWGPQVHLFVLFSCSRLLTYQVGTLLYACSWIAS